MHFKLDSFCYATMNRYSRTKRNREEEKKFRNMNKDFKGDQHQ